VTVRHIAFAYNFNDQDWLGGKNYFASLFGAIERLAISGYEWTFVTGIKTVTSLPNDFPWLRVVRTSLLDRLTPAWLARQVTLRTMGTDPLLALFLRRLNVHLLSHSGPLVPGGPVKCLPWLYDFQFTHLPEYWEPKHIQWAVKRYNIASRHGDGLILSSHDAAKDLAAFAPWCRLPRHVLQFVSNPVDFTRLPSKQDIVSRYGLPDRYIHLPNQFWTSKNHRVVIDALALLKSRGKSVTVVCSGKPVDGRQPQYVDELLRHRDELGVADEFKVLGIVPYADLQGLMAYASAVLNPSRFEGWSTTVEEAKTLQRPLLLSDIAVHREQSPLFGRFFAPDDVETLARLLLDALEQGSLPLVEHDISFDYERRLMGFGRAFIDAIDVTLGTSHGTG
jgi:glycosyltransferase involved in cell wall biosynthesis